MNDVISWISTKFQKSANEDCMKPVKKKINNFCAQANQKWNKHKRCAKQFEKKERLWLSYVTELKLSKSDVVNKKGRPCVVYSDGSVRQKRKLASKVSSTQGNDTNLLLHAASIAAHVSKENDLNFVLREAASSPSRPSKMKKLLTSDDKKPLPLSPAEALVFLIDNNLTKQQYINMREL